MEGLHYPLEQLRSIKQKRFDQALKVLEEKKERLHKEEALLKTAIEELETIVSHKKEKLLQMREALDSGQTTTSKIQQMKYYLEQVEEKVQEKERKRHDQEKKVAAAKAEVEAATRDMFSKKKDVEKLAIHKEEWSREVAKEMERQEAIEHDEQGAMIHETRKRQRGDR